MGKRRTIFECDSCHKEYSEADYNDSGSRAEIHFEGQYYDESIGQKTWKDDIQLCPECWEKLNKFLKEEMKIKLYTWSRF